MDEDTSKKNHLKTIDKNTPLSLGARKKVDSILQTDVSDFSNSNAKFMNSTRKLIKITNNNEQNSNDEIMKELKMLSDITDKEQGIEDERKSGELYNKLFLHDFIIGIFYLICIILFNFSYFLIYSLL